MWHDLNYAFRALRARPGFAAVVVATLALGIGVNTGTFSALNEVLLRPVPGAIKPGQLILLRRSTGGIETDGFSYPGYQDYRDRVTTVSGLMAYRGADLDVGLGGRPERLTGALVSGNYFKVLGIRPSRGRLIGDDDNRVPGGHAVAVLSHALWERRFGLDPAAIGRKITLNGYPFTVIGIIADHFRGTELFETVDIWIPIMMEKQARVMFESLNDRASTMVGVVGRLKPGITLEQSQAELDTLANRLEEPRRGRQARLIALRGIRADPEWRANAAPMMYALMAIVGLVLLIACANVANLVLARASSRRREVAIRLAVGAGRWRLIRYLMTENLLLAALGGAGGLLLATWSAAGYRYYFPEIRVTLDWRVLLFTMLISLLSGVLFGLAPAVQLGCQDLVSGLRGDPPGIRWQRVALRDLLVVAQIALSVVVIVAAGLCVRTLRNLRHVDPGFATRDGFLMQFKLRTAGYTETRSRAFYAELIERVRALPGVRAMSLADTMPPGWVWGANVEAEGGTRRSAEPLLHVGKNIVGPGYFETMEIRLLAGRDLTSLDAAGAPVVAIVNETMARKLWPGMQPLGRRFRWNGDGHDHGPWIEVIAIVRDGKYGWLVEETMPFFYSPFGQSHQLDMKLIVRTAGDPRPVLAMARNHALNIDANLAVPDVQTIRQHIEESLGSERIAVAMTAVFGLLSLVIAAVGLYAVVSYTVAQRAHELGIRMALGARHRDVLGLILRRGMVMAGTGVCTGTVLALGLIPVLRLNIYGVKASDPASLAVASAVLVPVALLASYVPARRVLRLDPAAAVRYE